MTSIDVTGLSAADVARVEQYVLELRGAQLGDDVDAMVEAYGVDGARTLLSQWTVKRLKAACKAAGMKKYSALKKAAVVEFMLADRGPQLAIVPAEEAPIVEWVSEDELEAA